VIPINKYNIVLKDSSLFWVFFLSIFSLPIKRMLYKRKGKASRDSLWMDKILKEDTLVKRVAESNKIILGKLLEVSGTLVSL
jgi:hypothetical protein